MGRNPYGGSVYPANVDGVEKFAHGLGVKAVVERGMRKLGPGILSLGIETGKAFSISNYGGLKSNIVIASLRSSYHLDLKVNRLDTYAGISYGHVFRSFEYHNDVAPEKKATRHVTVPSTGVYIGGTYYFSQSIGVNVEAGYDITLVQGGIIFKL